MGILLISVKSAKEDGLGTMFKQAASEKDFMDLSGLFLVVLLLFC